ncbi:hypothetical protein CISIN_1g0136761mg, partial [Citrus sinensis]
QRHNVLSI